MSNQPHYQEYSHTEIADAISVMLRRKEAVVYREFVLPSGVRADLFVVTPSGSRAIVEVKTAYRHHLLQNAREKYRAWCNYLFLAVPFIHPDDITTITNIYSMDTPERDVGVLLVTPHELKMHREPRRHELTTINEALIALQLTA